eukprot:GFUD01004528.1.p1 GENE.GFUD01004528.1~~GFUD01004528.1.p1  ORF type:complete len:436 (+),score=96.74 GFUD01004528.1:799-2106(+)
MVRLALILSLLSVVNCQISFFGGEVEEEDNSCTTPFNKQGKCVGLRQCGNVLSLLKKPIPEEVIGYLRKSVCSFTGLIPNVCCPEEKPTFGELTTASTITTKTTPDTLKEVHGAWSTWGEWSTCSGSCGEGDQARDRECNSPAPSNGGDECEGEARETQNCNTDQCQQLVEIPTECGRSFVGSSRLVNGRRAKRNAWPWLAALGYTDPNTGDVQYLCGATLVSAKHVVTAANCIRDDMVTVLLGEHVIGNDTDGANPEEFRVVKMTKHEKYNSSTFENDIALVEFETEVTFKKGIQPVCLPSKTPELLQENLVSKGVYIAGWGATNFKGPTSNLLLQGIINVVSNQECKERFSQFNNVEIGDTKICARDLNDRIDACQGDGGGPMVYLKKASDKKFRYHLIGVVSFGYQCAVKGFPGVYTRVTEYDQWIRDTVNK